jgi:hypothetical protein
MVYFQTKNPNLGKFCSALDWKMLIYFMAIWNILWTFGIFYGHLGYFMTIWYILSSFGNFFRFWYNILRKSGNPASDLGPYLFLNSLAI